MMSNIGLHSIKELNHYEEVSKLALDVAFRPYDETAEFMWRRMIDMMFEWQLRVFESTDHLASALQSWTPDILVVHWHDSEGNVAPTTNLVTSLRRKRDQQNANGPYLVGSYTILDVGTKSHHLEHSVYDAMLNRIDLIPTKVAITLWNWIHGTDIPLESW